MIEFPSKPFSAHDLEARGLSRQQLRDALACGQVRQLMRGVYLPDDQAVDPEVRAQAISLLVGPEQVICDRTAAWIHGVDVYGYGDLVGEPPVETCALRGSTRTRIAAADGRVRDLLPTDVMQLGGIRVTTPLRTALDLGCALGRHRALGCLDAFMRRCGVTQSDLRRELPRFKRRRGVVQLRALVPLADPRAESMRESWVRLDIHDAGLPAPEPQFWIAINGIPTYRLDLAYPTHRIAVEYDGEEWHRRTQAQKAADAERRKCLRDMGWIVIVVDKDGIRSEAWLEELAAALRPRTIRFRWELKKQATDFSTSHN